jgi:hypothetical protein
MAVSVQVECVQHHIVGDRGGVGNEFLAHLRAFNVYTQLHPHKAERQAVQQLVAMGGYTVTLDRAS